MGSAAQPAVEREPRKRAEGGYLLRPCLLGRESED